MQLKAKILYVDPITKTVGLTVNADLLHNTAPSFVSSEKFLDWLLCAENMMPFVMVCGSKLPNENLNLNSDGIEMLSCSEEY